MSVKLLMTSCDSASDVIAMHGVDKERFVNFRSYDIASEALAKFRRVKAGALVGKEIAARYDWKIGQEVTLEELNQIAFVVCGIFDSTNSAEDNVILAERRFIQEVTDKQGISNHVLVKVKPGYDVFDVCEQIDRLPMTIETTSKPEQVFLSETLNQLTDLVKVSKVVISVIVVVILVAMGNAISMATRERYHEFGIMRTLGFQKYAIMILVITEAIVMTLLGGGVGCLLVYAVVNSGYVQTVSTCGISITMKMSVMTWVGGISTVVVAGVLGSLFPSWHASQIEVCAVIRKKGG